MLVINYAQTSQLKCQKRGAEGHSDKSAEVKLNFREWVPIQASWCGKDLPVGNATVLFSFGLNLKSNQ